MPRPARRCQTRAQFKQGGVVFFLRVQVPKHDTANDTNTGPAAIYYSTIVPRVLVHNVM